MTIGSREVGEGQKAYIIGEIGINHNGDIHVATELMKVAAEAGCDAVKFQKRVPEIAVPEEQKAVMRETPWGIMSYLEYKERIEFGRKEYDAIDSYAHELGIEWFASPWDIPSVEFLDQYDIPALKLASASLTDVALMDAAAATGRPLIISTGMSTMEEIRDSVARVDGIDHLLAHTTSSYPCPVSDLNLSMIKSLRDEFEVPVGYSGHETGLQTTVAAVALGASFVERHITLDRAMWGTDQSASIEPGGLRRLVRDIRIVEEAMGDGVKRVYDAELPMRAKLRRAL